LVAPIYTLPALSAHIAIEYSLSKAVPIIVED
jgi:hypothetical protein